MHHEMWMWAGLALCLVPSVESTLPPSRAPTPAPCGPINDTHGVLFGDGPVVPGPVFVGGMVDVQCNRNFRFGLINGWGPTHYDATCFAGGTYRIRDTNEVQGLAATSCNLVSQFAVVHLAYQWPCVTSTLSLEHCIGYPDSVRLVIFLLSIASCSCCLRLSLCPCLCYPWSNLTRCTSRIYYLFLDDSPWPTLAPPRCL